jgi:ketosteroid isomerase-like protein
MTTPLEIVRGLYAAFAAGDIPAFLAALAPDIHWWGADFNSGKFLERPRSGSYYL